MIESIEGTRASARCAVCEQAREVDLAGLVVQLLDEATALVALPACACGAVEFVVRASAREHPSPGSRSHLHQLLVDHLHAELVERKQLAPGSDDAAKLCVPLSKEERERWFSKGLSLPDRVEPGT
jgi:hypothetical protein